MRLLWLFCFAFCLLAAFVFAACFSLSWGTHTVSDSHRATSVRCACHAQAHLDWLRCCAYPGLSPPPQTGPSKFLLLQASCLYEAILWDFTYPSCCCSPNSFNELLILHEMTQHTNVRGWMALVQLLHMHQPKLTQPLLSVSNPLPNTCDHLGMINTMSISDSYGVLQMCWLSKVSCNFSSYHALGRAKLLEACRTRPRRWPCRSIN